MDISVVSGTYNRLTHLQRMVTSARQSVGGLYGLTMDFVLVDGGSTDGTIEWCKSQPDIVLIEHGELRGAVKAFNDGAYAATGRYIVLANDDIEFLDLTILQGFIYMQDHPNCGIGCFYQNRNNRDWHVESMPVVINGRQASAPYGQVCIVPKWLGDRVGWWGDYLHTYGGDNELSARVYELGYQVSPVPGTKIIDNEADDNLRRINNITGGKDPRAVNGHHPDSWDWGRKWRGPMGLVGPVVKDSPELPNPIQANSRTVYLPIFEQGWPVQKEQKRGLREALAEVGPVAEFDYVGRAAAVGKERMLAELQSLVQQVKPTLVLTQLHNGKMIGPADITMLRSMAPQANFVNWNGDYWPDNLLSETGLKLAKVFHLQTTVNREADEEYKKQGITSAYWQIGWEPDGVGYEPEVFHDLVFLGSGYSKARQEFVRRLRGLKGVSFGLYGQGWPEGWAKGQNLYDFKSACKIYRGARISLGDSQWPDSGFVSNRAMQALAAGGAALAHQWFRGMDQLGLVDGETCIIWQTFSGLEERIYYYLAHEDERRRVAEAGQRLALERHSFQIRVRELFGLLDQRVSTLEEGWRW